MHLIASSHNKIKPFKKEKPKKKKKATVKHFLNCAAVSS